MAPAARRLLLGSVTHVIHGAATTRLDEHPDVARRVNVHGTRNALAFGAACPRLELFAHVSTAYVCGDREGLIRESDLVCGQSFLNSYEESKYRAEIEARSRAADLPIAVFRPSIIVGHSTSGCISSFASIYSPLRRVAEGSLRVLPCSANASLDLVPVDRVADAIARLAASGEADGRTYHLCAGSGRRTRVGDLVDATIRIAGEPGVPRPVFSPSAAATVPADAPARLRIFFAYPGLDRDFCMANTRRGLGTDLVPADLDFVTPMLECCRRTDWGRAPLREEVRR
jgi:long-chain acyl-CoA synthetase